MQMEGRPASFATATDHKCCLGDCGINFVDAADSHMEWRGRLVNFIEAKAIDASFSQNFNLDENCSLGLWVQGIGHLKFSHLPSFRRLALEHTQFHSFTGMIVSKVQNDELDDAELLLKNEFSQATRRILIAISELNEVLQQQTV